MSNQPSPTPLSEAALTRLETAVARLEKAMTAPAKPKAAPARDLFAPAADSSDLFAGDELTRSKQDYARLEGATRKVEERIDDMVDRLQTMLEP
jgi:hypothetical protein